MRGWDSTDEVPDAFDPPEESADSLLSAARIAEQVARDRHDQADAIRAGIAAAAHIWSGPRFEMFMRGAADAQVRARRLTEGSVAMANVLFRYAGAVRPIAEEIEDYRAGYLRQTEIAAEERARAARVQQAHLDFLAPHGIETYGLGATATTPEAYEALERAREAERRAAALVEEAEEAHRRLRRRAAELHAEMAEINHRTVPASDRLSPEETARRVHRVSGLGPVSVDDGSVLAALRLLARAGQDIPVTAINADGSVDWDELKQDHPVPKGGTDPRKVAAWWGGLARWQQEALVRDDPASLGNLDGVAAWARDRANRASIDRYRSRLQAQIDEFEAIADAAAGAPRPVHIPESGQIAELRDKLRALDRVEEVLRKPGPRQLVVLDPFSGHQLHAAVAIGDVDTADHVAVFTPGFKTNVQDKLVAYDNDMAALQKLSFKASKNLGQRGTVATVTWIGYDAPQTDEVLTPGRSVIGAGLAKKGGDKLAAFFTGISAARQDHPPHLTALGHSYGSLTTAYALRHRHTGVDDAVVFGSPGLSVSDVAKLHVPSGHLSEAEATDDRLVADSGAFGRDPSELLGIRHLRTDALDTPFGHTGNAHGHGGYLKAGTTSQYNIAAVVAGLAPQYQFEVPTILAPGAPPDAAFAPMPGDAG